MTSTTTPWPTPRRRGRAGPAAPPGRPARKPAEQPKPAAPAKPATKPVGKPATKPDAKPEAKPAAKPDAKPAGKPAAKAARPEGRPQPGAGRTASAPRAPFVLLIVALLSGALVSLLLLNTVLAQDAFILSRLQQSNKQLTQQRQELQTEIAQEESPERLEQKAKALGMKQPSTPAFVDPLSGEVTGRTIRPVPHAAAASAGAAGVVGVPGAVVPGDGVPPGAAP